MHMSDEYSSFYCDNFIYYIHTEIYALKSHVVSFRTKISSGQSEEPTTFSRVRKIVRPIRGHERCFFAAANFLPPVSFLGGRSFHPFIRHEDFFRGKLLLDQREFFRTEK